MPDEPTLIIQTDDGEIVEYYSGQSLIEEDKRTQDELLKTHIELLNLQIELRDLLEEDLIVWDLSTYTIEDCIRISKLIV